jgi:chitinase
MKLKNLLFALTIALSVASCGKKNDPTPIIDPPTTPKPYVPDNSFKIVAYLPGYRDPATIADAKYKMITHLNFAFLNINPAGNGTFNAMTSVETTRFNAAKLKAKANNLKFAISVMGGETVFASIAANATARTAFVTNLVDFAKTNELDGVDIDWEYPRTSGGNPSADFTALMQLLSTELHKVNKYLSAAITPGVYTSTNKDAIEPAVYQYVDFFNIMIYDGGVGYDSTEPLNHASMKMTDASLNQWLVNKAMPKEKAILGIPLYGKSSTGSSIAYKDIENSNANVNLNVATVNNVEYGFNGIAAVKIKAQKAKDRCNGIMFWEFAHDSNTSNSLIKAANDQLGRAYN